MPVIKPIITAVASVPVATGGTITTTVTPTVTRYFALIDEAMIGAALSTLTTASLVLDTTDVPAGIPVLLEIASFTNTASAITTQPTISAPVITIIS